MMLRARERIKVRRSQTRSFLESLLGHQEELFPALVGRASYLLLHNSGNLHLEKSESVGTKSLLEGRYQI